MKRQKQSNKQTNKLVDSDVVAAAADHLNENFVENEANNFNKSKSKTKHTPSDVKVIKYLLEPGINMCDAFHFNTGHFLFSGIFNI